jgi:YihY family inner membrane protein
MTYGAFLAIPPMLLLLVVGASLFVSAADLQTRVVEVVNGFVPGLAEAVPGHLKLDPTGQLGAGLIGVAGLMWTASGFAARIKTALAVIFRTRPTGLTIGRFSAGLVGVPVFVAIFALAALGGVANWLSLTGILGILVRILVDVGMAVVSVCFFLVVYWILTPDRALRMREHLPGAIAFAIGWAILQRFGSAYVSAVVARTTALYGAIGAIFGLLGFLYISMWLFLLGAEVSQTVRELRSNPEGAAVPRR